MNWAFQNPIFPQAAGLYASEWKRMLLKGELQSTLRLSLLPGLAAAAALEMKRTEVIRVSGNAPTVGSSPYFLSRRIRTKMGSHWMLDPGNDQIQTKFYAEGRPAWYASWW
jgi:hypothetical protein